LGGSSSRGNPGGAGFKVGLVGASHLSKRDLLWLTPVIAIYATLFLRHMVLSLTMTSEQLGISIDVIDANSYFEYDFGAD
jgi:hypothetical protein